MDEILSKAEHEKMAAVALHDEIQVVWVEGLGSGVQGFTV